jgi:hypothetical protein
MHFSNIKTSLLGRLFLYSLKPGQKIKLKTFKIFYKNLKIFPALKHSLIMAVNPGIAG